MEIIEKAKLKTLKAFDKGVKSMVSSLQKCGQTKEQIIGMLEAVWKQQGLNDEQIKKARKETKRYFK